MISSVFWNARVVKESKNFQTLSLKYEIDAKEFAVETKFKTRVSKFRPSRKIRKTSRHDNINRIYYFIGCLICELQ